MIKNSTIQTLQKKLGYNNHLIRLIDSFIIIPKNKVDDNKKIVMRDLTGFAAIYDLYEDFTCFDKEEFYIWEQVKKMRGYDDKFIKFKIHSSERAQLQIIKNTVCFKDKHDWVKSEFNVRDLS